MNYTAIQGKKNKSREVGKYKGPEAEASMVSLKQGKDCVAREK